ncbi:MAG: hypothetical protein V4668_04515 [Patescibacteria group bacterium]
MDENIKQQLLKAVYDRIKSGKKFEEIKVELNSAGYTESEITAIYSEANLAIQNENVATEDPENITKVSTVKKKSLRKIILYLLMGVLLLLIIVISSSFWLVSGSNSLIYRVSEFQSEVDAFAKLKGGDLTGICESSAVVSILDKVRSSARDVMCQGDESGLIVVASFKDKNISCITSNVIENNNKIQKFTCVETPDELAGAILPGAIDQKRSETPINIINRVTEYTIKPEPFTFPSGATLMRIRMPVPPKNNPVSTADGKFGFISESLVLIDGMMPSCLQHNLANRFFTSLIPFKDSFLATRSGIGESKLFKGCDTVGAQHEHVSDPIILGDDFAYITTSNGNLDSGSKKTLVYKGKEYGKGSNDITNVGLHAGEVMFVAVTGSGDYYEQTQSIYLGDKKIDEIIMKNGGVSTLFSIKGKLGYEMYYKNPRSYKIVLDGKQSDYLYSANTARIDSKFIGDNGYIGAGNSIIIFNDGVQMTAGPFSGQPGTIGFFSKGGVTQEHVMFAVHEGNKTSIYKNGELMSTIPGLVTTLAFSPSGQFGYYMDGKVYINNKKIEVASNITNNESAMRDAMFFDNENLFIMMKYPAEALFYKDSYDFKELGSIVNPTVIEGKLFLPVAKPIVKEGKKIGYENYIYYEADAPWAKELIESVNFIDYYSQSKNN